MARERILVQSSVSSTKELLLPAAGCLAAGWTESPMADNRPFHQPKVPAES